MTTQHLLTPPHLVAAMCADIAVTPQRAVADASAGPPPVCATAGALRCGVFATTVAGACRLACMSAERGFRLPTHERRAVRAISEAQDVRDVAVGLRQWLEDAYADGTISAAEVMDARVRIERLTREAQESIVAAQWTDAGERRAWGELAGGPTPRAIRYEREIVQQAEQIGFDLGQIIPFPQRGSVPQDAA